MLLCPKISMNDPAMAQPFAELMALKTYNPKQFAYIYKLYNEEEEWVYQGHKCLVSHGLCDEHTGLLPIVAKILDLQVIRKE